MAERGKWVTMNGAHVLIKDGQDPEEAFRDGENAGFDDSVKNGVKQGFDGTIHPGRDQKARFKIGLDFFAEKGILSQTISQLKKGVRSKEKEIEIHRLKIKNPQNVYPEWNEFTEARKQREIAHWDREIKTHEQEIEDRKKLISEKENK